MASTFACSLCKQECPYVQGNVFTAGDRKFCAPCYRILAEKQKEKREQAAATTPEPAPAPRNEFATNPARQKATASWMTQSSDPPDQGNQFATNPSGRVAPPASWGPKRAESVNQFTSNQPPSGGAPARATNPPRKEPEPAAASPRANDSYAPPQKTTLTRQTSSQDNYSTPKQAEPTPQEDEIGEDGRKKRLFDIVKPQEADVFSRYNKMMKDRQKEPEQKKAEPQVYRGGPWKCSSCGSRQGGEAKVCTLCGGLQPAMAAPELKKAPKKEADPTDPFGHISLVTWDECAPHISKW